MEDTAVAIFDCVADDSSELTFRKGDVIENIQQAADQGWYQGTLQKNGQTGLFPGNYVSFSKKQPKKLNAAEARANLMQKSSTLAQRTRTASEKAQITEPAIQKPLIQKAGPQIVVPPVNDVDPKVVSQLAKTFSETALKSNESLLESETQSLGLIPKVGKRPPLLVSNQAYVKITDDKTADNSSVPSNTQMPPPPRPFKPAALRANVPPTSTVLANKKFGDMESTTSTLEDGTLFRPSNTKTLNSTNLDFSTLNRYKQEFRKHDTDNDGYLQGDQVKSVWMKSGLDARSLGLIWNLCDPGNLGKLDMKGFVAGKTLKVIAGMFLIDEKLRGVPVPSTIPNELLERCG